MIYLILFFMLGLKLKMSAVYFTLLGASAVLYLVKILIENSES